MRQRLGPFARLRRSFGIPIELSWLAFGTAALVMLPIVAVASSVFLNSSRTWQHLVSTVLPTYITNSLLLSVGVGLGVTVLGVSTAWLVSVCRFPGRRWLEWGLLLPLSTPAYVLAYTYTDFLEVAGPLQGWLRQVLALEVGQYWFPDIRSLGGAIAMLTLVLYPYVYMLARVAFLDQSRRLIEASRILGCTPWQSFWRVGLPLARPSIAAGVSLTLMETLNDFGTVEYFGVNTFSTGIYRVWSGFGDRQDAFQLAGVLLAFIVVLLLTEQRSRGRTKYFQSVGKGEARCEYVLQGPRAATATLICLAPVTLGFLLPGFLLVWMAVENATQTFGSEFFADANHSFTLALIAALLATVIATGLAYGQRLRRTSLASRFSRLSTVGYAIPGSVIAVGIALPFGWLDDVINQITLATVGSRVGLVFSGTVAALVYAYIVRFLAVAFSTVEAGLSKIKPSLDEAARSLGKTPAQTLWLVHRPLLWSSLLTGGMLVFVDVMKELPATLMIRPFDFDTLAYRVYRLASDERLAEASGPALAIVLVGLIPVIGLSWQIARTSSR
ncbi:MAG: iron ABC transporter permease [Cyanobacteria bacterium P01_F01_bin.42]